MVWLLNATIIPARRRCVCQVDAETETVSGEALKEGNANHIHSVWRDLRHGWGDDLLAAHYAVFGH
jgi:hypothetical protein